MTARTSYVDAIAAHAAHAPGAPALVTADTVLTYRELVYRIEKLAVGLAARGVGPEQVCAVAVERGPQAVAAMAAVSRAGGAFLTLDVDAPPLRLQAMADSARATFLVTTAALAAKLDLTVPGPTALIDEEEGPRAAARRPLPDIAPRSLAYVAHTSGSTGTPNAVLIEHRGLTNYLRFVVRDYGLGPHTTALQLAPLGYDASIRDTFAPLVAGARLVLADRSVLLRAEGFADTVRQFGVDTVLSATPSLLTFLTRHEGIAEQLRGLRLTVSSGESLRPFLTAGGHRVLGGRLVNQYGPTECTMTSTRLRLPEEPETGADLIGTPIDGSSVRLLDAGLAPVPDGEVGEIHIAGAGVARGYGGRPALTADRFLPDPAGPPGARMYRTGDLARRRPDRTLEYLGRSDRQIKIRGYRVDPAEIEGELLGHPAVTGAVVTASTDDQGRTYLVAHVAGPTAEVADSALRTHLARTLPFHLMPRRFVRIDRVPTTSTGKADHRALSSPDTTTGPRPRPDLGDVRAAADRIAAQVRRTPLLVLDALPGILLKAEHLQHGGSFKVRGATNAMAGATAAGIVTGSSGNHGIAVARNGRALGVPVTVVMAAGASEDKERVIRSLGARVVRVDGGVAEREQRALACAERTGALFVPSSDQELVVAGQGTVGLEIFEDAPEVDTVFVPTGGGGLLAGICLAARAARRPVRIVGVEPTGANRYARSLAAGRPVAVPPSATVADGLRGQRPGAVPFPIIRDRVDALVDVSDQEILRAMRLLHGAGVAAEASGSVALAGALSEAGRPLWGSRVAVVVSGGNTPAALAAGLYARPGDRPPGEPA
ncbi:amino acid adenylation domain-containing protein [Streptacidiphilus sp. P02-A3a]|uniref:amino acid adenylation domain-containing protein n=1 Tax=Streptacidiphilus sp. P02-A3a TaxID=2704468 RepID=UPI0015FABFF8|nr:amino acid adenylation domain-containing protein [Streptacidiphilus sp. P02-A3a]